VLAALVVAPTIAAAGRAATPHVDVVRLDGVIGPANVHYALRGLDAAERDGAQALVIELDTSGGLPASVAEFTKAIHDAPVPVVVFSSPPSARAVSGSELLAKIDGRTVETAAGMRRLATRDARVDEIPTDLAERFMLVLGDPNVGFILMTIALYGLIFELGNPGSIFPGVIGGLALILAFASFAAVPVNVGGLLLIGFAVALFVAELMVPSHGVLTAGGIGSFTIGSLLLTDANAPFLRISLTLIVTVAILTAAFFTFVVGAGIRAQRRRVRTGHEGLIGALGVTRSVLAPSGTVFVQGELWCAETADGVIASGQPVRVVEVEGLRLSVCADESLARERR
jgi:membrane-bound ClpP family serine protease